MILKKYGKDICKSKTDVIFSQKKIFYVAYRFATTLHEVNDFKKRNEELIFIISYSPFQHANNHLHVGPCGARDCGIHKQQIC
jgi:hypothetical protein